MALISHHDKGLERIQFRTLGKVGILSLRKLLIFMNGKITNLKTHNKQ
jgi:hypothetical protein